MSLPSWPGWPRDTPVQDQLPRRALREFYLIPNEDRRLFKGIDQGYVPPDQAYGTSFEIENEVSG